MALNIGPPLFAIAIAFIGNTVLAQTLEGRLKQISDTKVVKLAHPMQRLKVELVGALGGDELHGRTLHRFRDRLGIAIVIFFTFGIRAHVFRRLSRASWPSA